MGSEAAHRQLVDQANIEPQQHVLDIGSGTGNLTLLIKGLHPLAEVVGLDPDPKALTRARRKAEERGLAVRLDPGFSDELPYADASFDRVVSAFMLHHLAPDEKAKTLREARRCSGAAAPSTRSTSKGGASSRTSSTMRTSETSIGFRLGRGLDEVPDVLTRLNVGVG